jgi:hypothetical protein
VEWARRDGSGIDSERKVDASDYAGLHKVAYVLMGAGALRTFLLLKVLRIVA